MAKLIWTEEAVTWLKDIFNYIVQDDPSAAKKVINGIYDKAQILKDFPQMGFVHKKEPEGEIRILLYGHYRITYLLSSDNLVKILGVFHGAMEIEKYLKNF